MELSTFDKIVLFLLVSMLLIFTVLYFITTSQIGLAYEGSILTPSYEEGRTVYTGKIQGNNAQFIVTNQRVITFVYGDKTYGPYTIVENPSLVPADKGYLTGYEILDGNELIFRGSVHIRSGYYEYYDENGNLQSPEITISTNNQSDIAPSVSDLLRLISDPQMTHKGNWVYWFAGLILSISLGLSVVFADALFHFRVSRWLNHAQDAEPSDLALTQRHMIWILMLLAILILFSLGLK